MKIKYKKREGLTVCAEEGNLTGHHVGDIENNEEYVHIVVSEYLYHNSRAP